MTIAIHAFRFLADNTSREDSYKEHIFSPADMPSWFNWWECSGFTITIDGTHIGGYHRSWLLEPESDAAHSAGGDDGNLKIEKLVWLDNREGDNELEWLDSILRQDTAHGAEMSAFIRNLTAETDLIFYKSGIYAHKLVWMGGAFVC